MRKSISQFMIGISSKVAHSDRIVELIQLTPKRDKGPQLTPKVKSCLPGGNPNNFNGQNSPLNVVTFERLQFKSATANNGKRRAAQQYYSIIIDLFANTADGFTYKIASCESTNLVVRGRSPGHYTDSQPDDGVQFHLMNQPGPDFSGKKRPTFTAASPVAYSPQNPYSAAPFYHPPSIATDSWIRSRNQSNQSASSFLSADNYAYDADFSQLRSPAMSNDVYRNSQLQSPGLQSPVMPSGSLQSPGAHDNTAFPNTSYGEPISWSNNYQNMGSNMNDNHYQNSILNEKAWDGEREDFPSMNFLDNARPSNDDYRQS
jgi:hypothetical protein